MPLGDSVRGAAAGVFAAAVWAAQEPLDMKVFGVPYSDPGLVGMPVHLANGALFGALYARFAPRLPGPAVAKGAAAGIAEHLATWPLTRFIPRVQLWGNRRAFWQALWRHVLFGAVLGTTLRSRPVSSAGRASDL